MADFTRPASGIVGGKAVTPVHKNIQGTVNAVAQGVGGVASVFSNRAKVKAENKKAALESRKNQALDALALEAFDAMATPEGREINRINNAVNAGSTSSSSGRSRIDVRVRSLLNQYPDMAFEMFQQFDELGIDSALFREFKAEQAALDQQEADARAADTAARQAAASRGIDISRLHDETVLMLGRRYMSDDQAMADAKARNEYIFAIQDQNMQISEHFRSDRAEQRAIRSAERDEARLRIDRAQNRRAQENHDFNVREREIRKNVNTVTETARNAVGMAFTEQVSAYAEQMGAAISSNDPEALKALDTRGSELMAGLRRMEADGLAVITDIPGHTEKDINDWQNYIQHYVGIIEDLTGGELSERQNRANILQDFADQTQIDAINIAPTYMRAKAIIGEQGAADFLLRARPDLISDLAEQIGTEMGALTFEMSRESKSANGNPEILGLWKRLRLGALEAPLTDTELVESLGPTYLTAVEIAAKEAPSTMTGEEATTILGDLAGPKSSAMTQKMRDIDPAASIPADMAAAEAVRNSFNSLLLRGGVVSWDRDGTREGTEQFFPSASAEGGFMITRETATGIMWDAEGQMFRGYGNKASQEKAAHLNNGLRWLIEYNRHYDAWTPEQVIDQLIYQQYPNVQPVDTTGTMNPAAESLPQ